jgi:20S proteasome alpha/beta subunit
MTCCIAAVCDDGKNIVLVADKMIGIGFIESEPDINKLLQLHKNWWVLFAGDDISPVFDIVDYAKRHIRDSLVKAKSNADEPIDLRLAMDAIRTGYEKKRLEEAESLYLKPIGWDVDSFNAGGQTNLPDFGEIKARLADFSFNIELLVAGFSEGKGYVFALYGSGPEKGLIKRHDVPGFYAIGSGGIGAVYMMYYRDMSSKMTLRETVYYAMEAKLFGEQASGVGERTDMYVATADGKFIRIQDEETIEKVLVPIFDRLKPRWPSDKDKAALNSIPELKGYPFTKAHRRKKKKKAKKRKPTTSEAESQPDREGSQSISGE